MSDTKYCPKCSNPLNETTLVAEVILTDEGFTTEHSEFYYCTTGGCERFGLLTVAVRDQPIN